MDYIKLHAVQEIALDFECFLRNTKRNFKQMYYNDIYVMYLYDIFPSHGFNFSYIILYLIVEHCVYIDFAVLCNIVYVAASQ